MKGDFVERDHQIAAALSFLDLQLRRPDLLSTIAAFAPHRLQRFDAAFVAGSSSLDAFANPDFFFGQSFVKQRVFFFFGRQCLFFADQKRIVVAGPVEQSAAVDFEDPGRHALQKHPVVGHEHQRRAEPEEKVFQPINRIDVEMVRRFVQQQQIRFGNQCPGQQNAPLHSGRQQLESRLAIEFHPGEDLVNIVLALPFVGNLPLAVQYSIRDDTGNGVLNVHRDFLIENRDPDSRRNHHGS